jgi:hypothetical protein
MLCPWELNPEAPGMLKLSGVVPRPEGTPANEGLNAESPGMPKPVWPLSGRGRL